MKRKIVAILYADIAGYSKLMAEDEEQTARRLAQHRAVFEDFVARFSGRVVNTAGDSILAEFPSAVEAVRCAIDVQESLKTHNLAYPSNQKMNCRIGVTIGDVVERDEDVMGNSVNIAARLEALAPPGGLCISHAVYEQVRGMMSVKFVDIGERTVKNIPFPVHAHTLALSPSTAWGMRGLGKTLARASARLPLILTVAGAIFAGAYLLSGNTPPSKPSETVVQTAQAQGATGGGRDVTSAIGQPSADGLPGRRGPCKQLRTICEQAGFQQGAAPLGNGLWVDCMLPILRGTPQRPRATKPLPKVDQNLAAACKTIIKNRRQGGGLLWELQ